VTRREQLSIEAARLFAEKGYHGTSVTDLAEAVGIRKSSLYAHMGAKDELLASIALTGAQAFHAELDAVDRDADSCEQIRQALRAHLRVVAQQTQVAIVFMREWRFLEGQARKSFLRERKRYESRIKAMFTTARDEGVLGPAVDVDDAVLMFFSVANWAYTWIAGRDPDVYADRFFVLLRDGLAAPSTSRSARAAGRRRAAA
jgi:AcrR family transcriptional regulator